MVGPLLRSRPASAKEGLMTRRAHPLNRRGGPHAFVSEGRRCPCLSADRLPQWSAAHSATPAHSAAPTDPRAYAARNAACRGAPDGRGRPHLLPLRKLDALRRFAIEAAVVLLRCPEPSRPPRPHRRKL